LSVSSSCAGHDPQSPTRIALRGDPELDDVVVEGISMFRAELLNSDRLWIACYLSGTGVDGDRITFEVASRGGRLVFEVIELPEGNVEAK
jgi:hypothetical protein